MVESMTEGWWQVLEHFGLSLKRAGTPTQGQGRAVMV